MKTNVNLTERAKNGRNGVQLVYILDCIKNSRIAADLGVEFKTDADALQFFFNCFNEEFNFAYNKRRFPNLQERIGEYLQGLPGCCDIDYTYHDIILLGVNWGVLSSTEGKKADKFIENFFSICAFRILQAAGKVGINPYKYAV
jgi:hypothetical protein